MDLECYSSTHLKYCFLLALPILLIWVILVPIIALKVVLHNKDHMSQGFTPNRFYWEFINLLRKFISVFCLVFSTYTRIAFGTMILFITSRVQTSLRPYKEEKHNKIEVLAINACIVTILSNFSFLESEQVESLDTWELLLVLIANSIFIGHWISLLSRSFGEKSKFARMIFGILGCLFCIGDTIKNEISGKEVNKQQASDINSNSRCEYPTEIPEESTDRHNKHGLFQYFLKFDVISVAGIESLQLLAKVIQKKKSKPHKSPEAHTKVEPKARHLHILTHRLANINTDPQKSSQNRLGLKPPAGNSIMFDSSSSSEHSELPNVIPKIRRNKEEEKQE
ncbi:unnamed protein product [Moneuplotes crassus]|uniref:Uncharacterized protein n=1 Tax=Euplotes crassus TaxID=5936 RepID=A0AAD1X7Y4_EUPCR|nr:unnamed protein product [Moneuplotes crassus]